jgi:hypothetical protein
LRGEAKMICPRMNSTVGRMRSKGKGFKPVQYLFGGIRRQGIDHCALWQKSQIPIIYYLLKIKSSYNIIIENKNKKLKNTLNFGYVE